MTPFEIDVAAEAPSSAAQSMPLTTLQEQFWFREMMYPGARSHILTAILVWHGPLDPQRLRRAVQATVDRHPSLRMRIVSGQGSVLAKIEQDVEVDLVFEDAADGGFEGLDWELPPKVRDALAGTPFDLERGPIFRCRVYCFGEGLHAIALAMHHIAADGWSVGLIARDIGQIYHSLASGRSDVAAGPETTGATVAALGPQPVALSPRKLDYWKKALDGAQPLLNLPAARPRPPVRRGNGGVHVCEIAAETAAAAEALANSRGATVFTVCAAAAAALLARLTGRRDIVAGVPLTNRLGPGDDEIVGLFANALPIRIAFDGETRFADLVDKSRAALVRALFHQDVPFERIVREINPVRDAGQHPVFQVVFNHFDFREPAFACDEFTVGLWPALHGGAAFDLELHFVEHQGGLCVLMNYDRDLFDASDVARWAGDFQSLLAAFAADPEQMADGPPVAADRPAPRAPAILPIPAGQDFSTLHERILEQARRFPGEVAVECGDRTITYADLVRRAEAVADRLRRLGIGPDRFVPVYLERSADLVVAILGVLMAGAAYVPIDPNQPPERIAFILGDVGAVAAVTETSLADRLPSDGPALIFVDAAPDDGRVTGDAPSPSAATGDNYAYCIYTSGSSGKPKGVIVRHRNVTRLFTSTHALFGFDERDVWTMFHSQAFDFSVWEIFGALLYGGRLVIVPQHVARTPEAFLALLRGAGVTVLNQTPSAFQQLLAAARSDPLGCRFPALRLVVFGGEALGLPMLRPWFDMAPPGAARLVNMYGITETTVHVTYRPIDAALLDGPPVSPIGVPIGDLAVHVLDSAMRPVPAGIPGEMYVAGAGVAAGYLNRDELTAERFIPDPFSDDPSARLYRTGDLARVNAQGELEYLGRADNQIKLRGHRIEPGEIEASLAGCAGVAAAAVRAVGETETEKRLVAWVCPGPGCDPSPASLRAHLDDRLPPYMIPADIVLVAQFPLTTNGKLDWSRLPVPERGHALRDSTYEAPATGTEAALAQLWEEILEVPRIGRDDNFFAAGGDSIRAAQFVRAARLAGMAVSVADLFRHQTIRALAASAAPGPEDEAEQGAADLAYAALPLPPGSAEFVEAYPLSGMQRHMARHYASNADHGEGVYHAQQVFRIRDGTPSPEALRAALQAIVDAEPVLRMRFLSNGEELYQAVRRQAAVELAVEDLTSLPEEQREDRLLAWRRDDCRRPFGIGPDEALVRFAFFRVTAAEFEFAMSIHHAIDDGWGNQVFLQRLFELYAAAKAGPVQALAPAANVFREYVAIERQALEHGTGEAFWAGRVLPPSAAEKAEGRGRPGASTRVIERDVVEAARGFARSLGVTLKSVFLQAFIETLAERDGDPGPTVGIVANGRTDRLSDPFQSLGLFWNLVPVHNPVIGGSWQERVGAAHHMLGETEAHATVPLPRICELHGGSELFQATFNFVNFHNSFTLPHGLEIAGNWWHDRFHYPLNLLAALDRARGEVRLHAEYVGSAFSEAEVSALLLRLEEIIERQCSWSKEAAYERL